MPFCTNCGTRLPDGTKFCPECGAKQDMPAPAAQPEPVTGALNFEAGPEIVPVTLSEPDFAGDTVGSAPVPPQPAAPRAWAQPSLEETEPLNEPEPVEMPTEPLEAPVPVSAPVQAAPAAPAAKPAKAAKKPMPKWLKLLIIFGSIGLALIAAIIIVVVVVFNKIKAAVTPDLTGTWTAVSMSAQGQTFDMSLVSDEPWTLELEKGGKCVLDLGDPMKGKWELDDDGDFEVEIDHTEWEGTLLGDTLTLNLDVGGSLGTVTFVREGSTLPITDPDIGPTDIPMTEPAVGAARTYVMYAAILGGVPQDLNALRELNMDQGTLVLNPDGTGTMSYLGAPEVPITWEDDDISYYGMDLDAEFEGDLVTVDISGTKITYAKEGSALLAAAETTPAETTPAVTEPAPLPEIEIPSDWTGTVAFSDFWGLDLEDYSDEAMLKVGYSNGGRPFAEIYLEDDPETIFVSLWVIPGEGVLEADIGEEDAWVHETYLTAFDGEDYNLYMNENGHLTMSFDFTSNEEDAFGCHMEMDFAQAANGAEPETTAAAVTGDGEWADPGWYGEGVADAKTLADAWEYLHNNEKVTYETMVAQIGCKGQCYVSDYINPEHLNVIWYTPDKDGLLKLEFKTTDDGIIYWQGNTSGSVTTYYN